MLYKKNGAVSCVGSGYPKMHSWSKFGYGQISIETATHSLIAVFPIKHLLRGAVLAPLFFSVYM